MSKTNNNIIDTVENFCKKHNVLFDGICGAQCNVQYIISILRDHFKVPGDKPDLYKLVQSKYDVRNYLYDNGVTKLKAFKIKTIQDLEKIESQLVFPVIAKPNNGIASIGVKRCENIKDIKNCITTIVNDIQSHPFFEGRRETLEITIEPFIEAIEFENNITQFTVDTVMLNGKVKFFGICAAHKPSPPYFLVDRYYCCQKIIPEKVKQSFKMYSFKILKCLGFQNGFFHLEMMMTKNGPELIELNERMGCMVSLYPKTFGIPSFFDMEAFIATGTDFEIKAKPTTISVYGQFVAYFKTTGVLKLTNQLEHADNVRRICNDGDCIKGSDNGCPDVFGYVFVKGDNMSHINTIMDSIQQQIDNMVVYKDMLVN